MNVSGLDDAIPWEMVDRIRHLFPGSARPSPKDRISDGRKLGVVSNCNAVTRSIEFAFTNKGKSETIEFELPGDYPLDFTDGPKVVTNVQDLLGKKLAIHFKQKFTINTEGIKSIVHEISKIEVNPPPRLRITLADNKSNFE